VVRKYYPDNSKVKTKVSKVDEDLEDDVYECTHCAARGYKCDGGQPCYRCVLAKGWRMDNPCTYIRSGSRESFTVVPYEADTDLGTVVLRDDWQSIIRDRYTTFRSTVTAPVTAPVGTSSSTADALFASTFPHGWDRLRVVGSGLLCGIRALYRSLIH
jgi:hypothetical protein